MELFWLTYIVSFYLLYVILFRGTYKDKKVKHPIYMWIIGLILALIPGFNIFFMLAEIVFSIECKNIKYNSFLFKQL